MRPLPRTHRRPSEPTDSPAPLVRHQRRFAIAAVFAAAVFAATFVTTLIRRSPGVSMAAVGIEIASATAAAACWTSADQAKMLAQLTDGNMADEAAFAFHLGADIADAYPAPGPRTEPEPTRGPIIR